MAIQKNIIAISLILSSLSAFAIDQSGIEKSIQLKDGSTVHIFKDGKMAMENQFGRPFRMKEGVVMDTTDGKSMTMKGDEVARLSNAQRVHMRP